LTFLVSPTEPPKLREAGATSPIAETYGADILVPAHGYFIGVQRKQFPGDFLSSLHDGRLGDSLIKLTKCEMRILLLEGDPAWSVNGHLEGYPHGASFTRKQLTGLILSAALELGVLTVWTKNLAETIDYLSLVEAWGQKEKHQSLFTRAGIPGKDGRKRRHSKRDWVVHMLQGFDGIGPELANSIFDEFGRAPFQLTPEDEERLGEVPKIGPKRVKAIKEVLG
jgi:ERCC4-type nuclease